MILFPDGEVRLPGAVELRAVPAPRDSSAGADPKVRDDRIGLVTRGGRYFVRSWSTGAGPPAVDPPVDPRQDAPDQETWDEVEVMEEATCAAEGPSLLVGSACGEVVILQRPPTTQGLARIAAQAHECEVADVVWLSPGSVASLGVDGTCRRWRLTSEPGVDVAAPLSLPTAGAPADLLPYVDRLAEAPLDATTLRGLASELAMRSSRGVTFLRACLQDPRARVRYRTLWLIGEDGLWGFANEFVNALHDVNESVRRAAVGAIDALDEVACVEALEALLERETDPTIRVPAERVLERFVGDS